MDNFVTHTPDELISASIPKLEDEDGIVDSVVAEIVEAANKVHRKTMETEHLIEVQHLLEILHENEDE